MELKVILSIGNKVSDGSNRTFMELKDRDDIVQQNDKGVLIVPLWN